MRIAPPGELLDLSGGGFVAKLKLKPELNHPALLKACGKNDYTLTKAFVDHGYRLALGTMHI